MSKKKTIRFIDCGANIGQSAEWAIENLSNIGYDLKIDCFEPNIELVETIKNKNLPNVTVHSNAVDTKASTKKFYLQDWGAKTGSSLFKFKESTLQEMGFFGRVAVRKEIDGKEAFVDLKFRPPDHPDIPPEGQNVWLPMGSELFLELMKLGELQDEHLLYTSYDVECIDIVSWLEQNIDFENELSILKLDVEGSEFDIVYKILEAQLNKKLGALLVEWTPLAKLHYVKAFAEEDLPEKIEGLIKTTHTEGVFNFTYDWHYPKKAKEPLLQYINSLK
jgi:hypothetical protein